jgi:DNA-binding LytR/AlgR family response regulator
LRIGICDDEEIIRNELMQLCKGFQEINLIEFDIIGFSSGEELLKYQDPIDILFLDVQMKGINGLKTALKIRENDESMSIIFVTGYRSFMQEGYRVKAFRYLLKPLKKEDLIKALSEAITDLTKNNKAILAKDGTTFYVRLKDVLYVEAGRRYSLVRTLKLCFESAMVMSEWENILNNGDFYRVHKSYIVNMQYVEKIEKNITLDNGEKVELSFRQNAKFKKACKEYRRRNAR